MKENGSSLKVVLICIAMLIISCAPEPDAATSSLGTATKALLATTRPLPFLAGQRVGIAQGNHGVPTHSGSLAYAIDFGLGGTSDRGLPVVATNDGVVRDITAGMIDTKNSSCGFGNTVVYCSSYSAGPCEREGHLREVFVKKGELVKRGQVLGLLGGSGVSDGPHLHNQMQSTYGGVSVSSEYTYRASKSSPQSSTGTWQDTGILNQEVCQSSPGNPCAISDNEGLLGTKSEKYAAFVGSVADPRSELEENEGWNGYGWYSTFTACIDDDGDSETTCNNEAAYRKNAYIRRFTGGSFVNTAIVYDALGGATSAYTVRTGFLKDAQNGWDALGGPASALGMPLEDERQTATGSEQCFQWGKLQWNSQTNAVTRVSYQASAEGGKSIGPGVYAPDGIRTVHYWKSGASYRIADAWLRNGGKPQLGEPASHNGADPGAHKWDKSRFIIQNFKGGSLGEAAIMYDPEAGKYADVLSSVPEEGWNRAYVIRTGFWNWYRYNNGINALKAPISDEYPQPGGSRQDFLCGYLVWSNSTNAVTAMPNPGSPGCLIAETQLLDDACHTPKPSDPTQVGLDVGGDGSPAQNVIVCTTGPADMLVEITGPVQNGLFAPISGSTIYLEYGSDTDGWAAYTSGKPKATWIGDMATVNLPRAYSLILGSSVQNMNFFLYNPSTGQQGWFDLSKWYVTGDCWKVGGGIRHSIPQPATGSITCTMDSSALTVNVNGPVQSLLVGGSVANPTRILYGSNTDGWTVPYSSGKSSTLWNGTNTHTLVLPPNVYDFNLYATDGVSGRWFDLTDADSDGDSWTVGGACWKNGGVITHAAPPNGTINCVENGPDMTVTVTGSIPNGIWSPVPSGSPVYLEYGSDTDGWTPYTSGKPKATYSSSTGSYSMILGSSVQNFNFFLYGSASGQTSWFNLNNWTVTGDCWRDGGGIRH